jgi:hypothetical protein
MRHAFTLLCIFLCVVLVTASLHYGCSPSLILSLILDCTVLSAFSVRSLLALSPFFCSNDSQVGRNLIHPPFKGVAMYLCLTPRTAGRVLEYSTRKNWCFRVDNSEETPLPVTNPAILRNLGEMFKLCTWALTKFTKRTSNRHKNLRFWCILLFFGHYHI